MMIDEIERLCMTPAAYPHAAQAFIWSWTA
jgi:hypothetical protein